MVLNREEMFIANICGESYDLPAPQTRNELLLKSILDGDETTLSPVTRIELYLASISGKDVGDLPQPRTRIEMYLASIAGMEIEPPIPLTSLEQWLASWYESGGSGEEFTTEFLPIVSIMDALAKPARAVVAKMEPIQDLHGYDSPWPAGGGKNLFNESSTTQELSPVYAYDGTALTGVRSGFDIQLPEGTYTIKYNSDSVIQDYTYGNVLDSNDDFVSGFRLTTDTVRPATTFTIQSGQFLRIFKGTTGGTLDVSGAKIQLESGSTETAYAPYENLCPISGRTGVTVTRTGKNLLEPSNVKNLYVGGVTGLAIGNDGVLVCFRAKKGVTYTINGTRGTRNGLYKTTLMPNELASGESVDSKVLNSNPPITITADEDVTYAYYANDIWNESIAESYWIELGSTVSTYEPYSGNTYPVSWQTEAGTVYGGTVDVVSGVLTVDRAMVDLGTLTWRFNQASLGGFDTMEIASLVAGGNDAICSMYPNLGEPMTSGNITAHNVFFRINKKADGTAESGNFGLGALFIKDTTYTDADTFKTAMDGVQLCYELATPQTYQLTPTQIQLLKGANVLWSDANAVQVTYLKKQDS